MSEAKAKLKSGGKRFSKFSIVGLSNAAIDIGVLNLFLWLEPTRDVTLLVIYNGVALVLANLNSYAWNTLWTFRGGPNMM
ncbi:MAG: GtrA family protein [Rubrobacteraceae bacterium]|nr:GtrA family protein [Rubrobacteraceae bacterium]